MDRIDYLKSIGKVNNGSIFHTYSTQFLLPMLNLKISDFQDCLINVHINNNMITPELIIVLNNKHGVENGLVKCRINDNYLDDYEDESEIIIKFQVPGEYLGDYVKFIKGEYSKFSDNFKTVLTKRYGKNLMKDDDPMLVTMYDTIYPKVYKRQAIADKLGVSLEYINEVMECPDLSYEIYQPLKQLEEQSDEIHE